MELRAIAFQAKHKSPEILVLLDDIAANLIPSRVTDRRFHPEDALYATRASADVPLIFESRYCLGALLEDRRGDESSIGAQQLCAGQHDHPVRDPLGGGGGPVHELGHLGRAAGLVGQQPGPVGRQQQQRATS